MFINSFVKWILIDEYIFFLISVVTMNSYLAIAFVVSLAVMQVTSQGTSSNSHQPLNIGIASLLHEFLLHDLMIDERKIRFKFKILKLYYSSYLNHHNIYQLSIVDLFFKILGKGYPIEQLFKDTLITFKHIHRLGIVFESALACV